jgi:hypothetical protein
MSSEDKETMSMNPSDELNEDAMLQLAMELSMQSDGPTEHAAPVPVQPAAVDTAEEVEAVTPVKKIEFKEATPPAVEQTAAPVEGEKKKKKKKKKQSFKSLMAGLTQTDTTVEQEKQNEQDRLKKITGGGTFSKLDRI